MNALKDIKAIQEYLDYVKIHIENVEKAWDEIKEKCKHENFIYDDHLYHLINMEVKNHDVSKLTEHEFIQYQMAFYPARVNSGKYDVEEAWQHHIRENPHHWDWPK